MINDGKPYVNTVVLPKENIDVYRTIQKDWRTLASSFPGMYNVVLVESNLIPDKENSHKIKVVLKHSNYIDMLERGNIKQKIEEICEKRYGTHIEIEFMENYDITEDHDYVTEKDLDKINFDIKRE